MKTPDGSNPGSRIEKKEKPDFALDKWGYTEADIKKLINVISKDRNPSVREGLEEALREGGGKAFGLEICQEIANNFRNTEHRLLVPPWEIVKDPRGIDPDKTKGKILRSSGLKEDWLDSRAGTYRSFKFPGDVGDFIWHRDEKFDFKLPETPYVFQELKKGYGLVVDIGHSELSGKTIARIASGLDREIGLTSATEDFEATVGVWTTEDGSSVLPVRQFNYDESLFKKDDLSSNSFVKSIFAAIKDTGIDFGVQLELVVDPKEPGTFHLVQIRPSPQKMRHQVVTGLGGFEKEKGILVAQSAITNSRFSGRAYPELLGTRLRNIYEIGNRISGRSYEGNVKNAFQQMQRTVFQGLGVGIYDSNYSGMDMHWLEYAGGYNTYLGALAEGNVIQITPKAIRPNSHHGWLEHIPESAMVYDLLDEDCGMISLRKEEIDAIVEKLGKEKGEIGVISDGLIANVYLLKK